MGKKPDQIEHEISDQRARISDHLQTLQSRAQKDAGSVREEAGSRASNAIGDARGVLSSYGVVRNHPLSAVAGALGFGVLLGAFLGVPRS